MAKIFTAATGDGTTDEIRRSGDEVKSGILLVKKTNTGTCVVTVKEATTAAILATVTVAADNPFAGYAEFPMPKNFYIEIASTSGTIALDAHVDGAES